MTRKLTEESKMKICPINLGIFVSNCSSIKNECVLFTKTSPFLKFKQILVHEGPVQQGSEFLEILFACKKL